MVYFCKQHNSCFACVRCVYVLLLFLLFVFAILSLFVAVSQNAHRPPCAIWCTNHKQYAERIFVFALHSNRCSPPPAFVPALHRLTTLLVCDNNIATWPLVSCTITIDLTARETRNNTHTHTQNTHFYRCFYTKILCGEIAFGHQHSATAIAFDIFYGRSPLAGQTSHKTYKIYCGSEKRKLKYVPTVPMFHLAVVVVAAITALKCP